MWWIAGRKLAVRGCICTLLQVCTTTRKDWCRRRGRSNVVQTTVANLQQHAAPLTRDGDHPKHSKDPSLLLNHRLHAAQNFVVFPAQFPNAPFRRGNIQGKEKTALEYIRITLWVIRATPALRCRSIGNSREKRNVELTIHSVKQGLCCVNIRPEQRVG